MTNSLAKIFALAAATTMAAAPSALLAEPGGNGNGNGGGASAAAHANAGGNGHGQMMADARSGGQWGEISSELKGLNASNASQNGLENADPDSMPGRLYAYQQTGGLTIDDIQDINDARQEVATLEDITDEAKLARYDDDDDGEISEEEQEAYQEELDAARAIVDQLEEEFGDAYAALAATREGSLTLSAEALAELNSRLGL